MVWSLYEIQVFRKEWVILSCCHLINNSKFLIAKQYRYWVISEIPFCAFLKKFQVIIELVLRTDLENFGDLHKSINDEFPSIQKMLYYKIFSLHVLGIFNLEGFTKPLFGFTIITFFMWNWIIHFLTYSLMLPPLIKLLFFTISWCPYSDVRLVDFCNFHDFSCNR